MSKIAILMSTYNGEVFIDEQLKSIANQETEHIITLYVRDDGSDDDTKKIIDKWRNLINIIYIQGENVGPADSFWEMLKEKKILADYYAFCDQDDIWDYDKLDIAVKRLKGNVHLYASNCRIIDEFGNIIETRRKKKTPDYHIENLFVSGITQGCAMVFTNSLREFICSKKITCIPMHDLIVCIYAVCYGELFWDIEPHFSYRFHKNNVVACSRKNKIQSKIDTIKKWIINKNKMQFVARELLSNNCCFNRETNNFLQCIATCKKSLYSKLFLLKYPQLDNCEKKALRSFKIKVLLGII